MTSNVELIQKLQHDKYDAELGGEIEDILRTGGLTWQGETMSVRINDAMNAIKEGISVGLEMLGMPVHEDPSLQDTPNRYAKMLVGDLTWGLNWEMFPKCTVVPNDGNYDQMVLVDNIRTISLCEHHLQTIDGVTHIAYIPGDNVLGLSKFARITEFFARRPQIQERMTEQIYAALAHVLQTDDVAVVQKCEHYCMKARGALQPNAMTTTDKMGGRFLTNDALRKEFLDAIGR